MKSKYKRWSQKQVNQLLEDYGDKPIATIAREIDKPVGSLYCILKQEGISTHANYWSPEEIHILKTHYSSVSNEELRTTLKRSEDAIQFKASSLGLGKDQWWTDLEKNELIQLRLSGSSYKEMAIALSKTESGIHYMLIQLGLTSSIRRWTDKELDTIESMASLGKFTYVDIATELNASPSQISGTCSYRGWTRKIKKSKSRGEEILGHLLNKKFDKVMEQFLVGEKLRLDFFVPELNLGWEYDGEQHFRFNSHFHKSEEAFQHAKGLDRLKEDLCSRLGIHLIRIGFQEELTVDLVDQKIQEVGPGPGTIQLEDGKVNGGMLTKSTLRLREHQQEQKLLTRERRQQYLKSDRHQNELQKQREYRKKQYRKAKARQ